MSFWQDLIDWVGGYPFEVATPEQIFDFYRHHGFFLTRLQTCRGTLGCNQFVFEKCAFDADVSKERQSVAFSMNRRVKS